MTGLSTWAWAPVGGMPEGGSEGAEGESVARLGSARGHGLGGAGGHGGSTGHE